MTPHNLSEQCACPNIVFSCMLLLQIFSIFTSLNGRDITLPLLLFRGDCSPLQNGRRKHAPRNDSHPCINLHLAEPCS